MSFWSGLRKYWFACTCVLLMFYSGFYIFTGNRGLPRYFYLQKELKTAYEMDNNYLAQKKKLETKVKYFSADNLDIDLLEERARVVLNYVESDEFVIIDADKK